MKDPVWTYLLFMNAGGFLMMGLDKLSAKLNARRIPENLFFVLSAVGGALGVVLGMLSFHHKTSKTSFQVKIALAAVLSLGLLFVLGLVP